MDDVDTILEAAETLNRLAKKYHAMELPDELRKAQVLNSACSALEAARWAAFAAAELVEVHEHRGDRVGATAE